MTDQIQCKLCNKIVDCLHMNLLHCECGNLVVNGVTRTIEARKDDSYLWIKLSLEEEGKPFVKIDSNHNDIQPSPQKDKTIEVRFIGNERLKLIDDMIASYESLPPKAMAGPVTAYDLLSVLLLLKSVLRDALDSVSCDMIAENDSPTS